MICDKCRRPISQDEPYYEIIMKSEKKGSEFTGYYYFHITCGNKIISSIWTVIQKKLKA